MVPRGFKDSALASIIDRNRSGVFLLKKTNAKVVEGSITAVCKTVAKIKASMVRIHPLAQCDAYKFRLVTDFIKEGV